MAKRALCIGTNNYPALRLLRLRIRAMATRPHRPATSGRRRSIATSYTIIGLLSCLALCMASGGDRVQASTVTAQVAPDAEFVWAMEQRFGADNVNNHSFQSGSDNLPDYWVGRTRKCVYGDCSVYQEIDKLRGSWPDRKTMDFEEWQAAIAEIERQVAELLQRAGTYIDPYIFPDRWKVMFHALQGNNSYTWTIDGVVVPETGQHIEHTFPASMLGATGDAHVVTLTVRDQAGHSVSSTQTVVLRDLLIVSIGDSTASGEGNPHVNQEFDENSEMTGAGPIWQDTEVDSGGSRFSRCHRSMHAGQALAAAHLGTKFPHISVTFIHLACSGAKIEEGLLGSYSGIEQPDGGYLGPQINVLASLVCPPVGQCDTSRPQRTIDALLVAIGGNDAGFVDIATDCAKPVWRCNDNKELRDKTSQLLTLLPDKLALLDLAISRRPFQATRVYIQEYGDPTHSRFEGFCRGPIELFPEFTYANGVRWTGVDLLSGIDEFENEWTFQSLIHPTNPRSLNGTIQQAVASINANNAVPGNDQKWNYVGGIYDQFYRHGYCAGYGDTDTSAWFRTASEAYRLQGKRYGFVPSDGTLHPNHHGHMAMRDAFIKVLTQTLDLVPPVVDTTPPTLTLPFNMTVEATSGVGAVANFSVVGLDGVDGSVTVSCNPASGFSFSFGTTRVTCSSTDLQGNTSSGSFPVTVVDTTPPWFHVLVHDELEPTSAAGVTVTQLATAYDTVDGAVPVTCAPSSGFSFPIGTTQVTCSATDRRGNRASTTFPVVVLDSPFDCAAVRSYIASLERDIHALELRLQTGDGDKPQLLEQSRALKATLALMQQRALTVCPAAIERKALFVTQNVPGQMVAGRTYTVSVTMQNTGNSTWSSAELSLARFTEPTGQPDLGIPSRQLAWIGTARRPDNVFVRCDSSVHFWLPLFSMADGSGRSDVVR